MTALIRIKQLELSIKLLIALFLILTVLFLILPSTTFAQTVATPSASSIPTYIPPTSPLYTDLLVNNLFHSFSCLAIGQSTIGQPCLSYQVTKNAEGMVQSVPVLSSVNLSGGTLGAVTSVIGALYLNPPVRTADYLATVGHGLGIVKEAHAQGVVGSGAAVLNPILSLWQVSRNISYVIMIVIFVVIGLMVMFRNRINPQTVITAQTALPGLVIGLILITFSYFLAGLISDVAFLGTNIVGYYFQAAQGKGTQDLVTDVSEKNVLKLMSPLTGILTQGNVSQALDSIWKSLERPNRQPLNPLDFDPSRAITAIAALMIAQLVMPFAGMFGGIGQVVGGVVSFVPTIVNPTGMVGFALAFIGMVILIYAMIKLLLRLINNYITIIFLTITAPFQLLAAALPGRQGLATNWVLNMLANVLAFPAVLAVLYFVAFLLGPSFINEYYPECGQNQPGCVFRISQLNQAQQDSVISTAYAQGINDSKITGPAHFPLFGGMSLNFINLLLAFGALMALPSIPDIIARTIGRVGVAGQLIGQEISGSYAAGQRYTGQFQSGVGGMAGQVGRLRDEPGWIYQGNKWERVTGATYGGLTDQQKLQSGYRPGQLTRAVSGVRSILGRGPVSKPPTSNKP